MPPIYLGHLHRLRRHLLRSIESLAISNRTYLTEAQSAVQRNIAPESLDFLKHLRHPGQQPTCTPATVMDACERYDEALLLLLAHSPPAAAARAFQLA